MDEITFSKKKNPENNKKAAIEPRESKKRGGGRIQWNQEVTGTFTNKKLDNPDLRQFSDGQGGYIYVLNKDLPSKR